MASLLKELGKRAIQAREWFALERDDDDRAGSSSRAAWKCSARSRAREPRPRRDALLALEGQGRVLRGRFTPVATELEWCDRRLLARIHRYTLNRLRAEIEPVSAAEFMRFLAHWQHVAAEDPCKAPKASPAVVEQLEGFELAAAAWERDVLPARVADYGAEQIDRLCMSGSVAWGRLTPAAAPGAAALLADRADAARAPGRVEERSAIPSTSSLPKEKRSVRRSRSAVRRSSTSW